MFELSMVIHVVVDEDIVAVGVWVFLLLECFKLKYIH